MILSVSHLEHNNVNLLQNSVPFDEVKLNNSIFKEGNSKIHIILFKLLTSHECMTKTSTNSFPFRTSEL